MSASRCLRIALSLVVAACAGCDSTEPPPPEPVTTDHGIVFVSDTDHAQGEVYYINLDGSGLQRLTVDTFYDDDPAVSPDGTRIAYTCRVEGDPLANLIDICAMDLDGSNQVRLTTDSSIDFFPRWKPDGQTIGFTSERQNGGVGRNLWLMDPTGANQRALTTPAAVVYEAGQWNPAGDRLVLTYRDLGPTIDLYFINADGSGLAPFVTSPRREERAVWSPEGQRLAYSVLGAMGFHLEVRDASGGHVVTIDSAGYYNDVSWSHDGAELVAACTGFASGGLCRITPSGRRITPIPNTPQGAASPDWVP